jgi:hypothetical protein
MERRAQEAGSKEREAGASKPRFDARPPLGAGPRLPLGTGLPTSPKRRSHVSPILETCGRDRAASETRTAEAWGTAPHPTGIPTVVAKHSDGWTASHWSVPWDARVLMAPIYRWGQPAIIAPQQFRHAEPRLHQSTDQPTSIHQCMASCKQEKRENLERQSDAAIVCRWGAKRVRTGRLGETRLRQRAAAATSVGRGSVPSRRDGVTTYCLCACEGEEIGSINSTRGPEQRPKDIAAVQKIPN